MPESKIDHFVKSLQIFFRIDLGPENLHTTQQHNAIEEETLGV